MNTDEAPEALQDGNEVLYLTQIRLMPVEDITGNLLPVPAVMVRMDGMYGIDSKLPVTYKVLIPVAALSGISYIFSDAAKELGVTEE